MKALFACIFPVALIACQQQTNQKQIKESSETTERTLTGREEIKEQGLEITGQLQQVLARQLQRAIADSGVAYALQYCNVQAYPLTDSISTLRNVKVKRVSHKPRNPENNADEDELSILESFQRLMEEGKTLSPVVEETNEKFTYYAPITIFSPLCLKCHGIPGQDIAPEDFIVINMLYPEDHATGFKMNDLRGMWRVDFDKAAWVQ